MKVAVIVFIALILANPMAAFAAAKTILEQGEELEVSYFEWRLSQELLLKEQTLLTSTKETVTSVEMAECADRILRRQRIESAKREHLEAVIQSAPTLQSAWLNALALRAKAQLPQQQTQAAEPDAETSADLLAKVVTKTLPHLRWECLQQLLGKAPVEKFFSQRVGFNPWNAKPGSASRNANNSGLEIVLLEQRSARGNKPELAETLKQNGYSVVIFQPTEFSEPLEQALELQNFISERRSQHDAQLLIISQGIASAVVYSLLDKFSSYRNSNEISGWINIDGKIFGEELTNKNISRQLRAQGSHKPNGRALASLDPAELRKQQRLIEDISRSTEIPLSLGSGFPILNIVTTAKQSKPKEDLMHAVVPDGKNYYWDHEVATPEFMEIVAAATQR